ncbi:MAG: hypothetical protein ABIQ31_06345 [Ferruginibacter sp.]
MFKINTRLQGPDEKRSSKQSLPHNVTFTRRINDKQIDGRNISLPDKSTSARPEQVCTTTSLTVADMLFKKNEKILSFMGTITSMS